jgi:hypothetical protein
MPNQIFSALRASAALLYTTVSFHFISRRGDTTSAVGDNTYCSGDNAKTIVYRRLQREARTSATICRLSFAEPLFHSDSLQPCRRSSTDHVLRLANWELAQNGVA